MKIFLDTNVLIDMALNRNQNHKNAEKIVLSCISRENQGFVTSHSLTDFFYITRKDYSSEMRRTWISFIISNFTILTEDNETFSNCLKVEPFDDLEDLLQMECASQAQLDYIITENFKDFANSEIPIISISDFAEKYIRQNYQA